MPDPNATKKLSKVIGKEIFLKLHKCSLKFMKSGETFSSQGSTYRMCTLKPIHEEGCGEEVQIHLRINVNKHEEDLGLMDVDFYVNREDFDEQIKSVLKENEDKE